MRIWNREFGLGLVNLFGGAPWGREHRGCTATWGKACSCSSGSSERDGGPLRLVLMSKKLQLAPL